MFDPVLWFVLAWNLFVTLKIPWVWHWVRVGVCFSRWVGRDLGCGTGCLMIRIG